MEVTRASIDKYSFVISGDAITCVCVGGGGGGGGEGGREGSNRRSGSAGKGEARGEGIIYLEEKEKVQRDGMKADTLFGNFLPNHKCKT